MFCTTVSIFDRFLIVVFHRSQDKGILLVILGYFSLFFSENICCDHVYERGAVVKWLEQLGYGAESRRIA